MWFEWSNQNYAKKNGVVVTSPLRPITFTKIIGVKTMVSKVEDTKKNEKGYREPKDALSGKAPRHQKAALETKFEKEPISDETAIVPNLDKTITLKFVDKAAFLDALEQWEEENKLELPMDFDVDGYIVAVPEDKVTEFRIFMSEKDIEEITDNMEEIDENIAETKNLSSLALMEDKSITPSNVNDESNPDDIKELLKQPNKLRYVRKETEKSLTIGQ